MDFYELTISIEDPREVERRKLFGIEDPDAPTREDLAEALELITLLTIWFLCPIFAKVEAFTEKKPTKSLY
ncbi:hypothetical protein LINGRAHAP2_LOCUS2336 [Linum grandiflorum]